MHTSHKREEPNPDVGYETRDIDYSAIGKVAFVFTFFALGSFVLVALYFYFFNPQTMSTLDPRKPLPTIEVQSNTAVRADIQTLRQHETDTLSKGGQNPDGTSRMPIDQAMALVAKRGLSTTTTEVPAESPGNTIPQNALAPGEKPGPAMAPNGKPAPLTGDIGMAPGGTP